jgi:hypothetical protein
MEMRQQSEDTLRKIGDAAHMLERLYVAWKQRVITHYQALPSDKKAFEKAAGIIAENKFDPDVFFLAQVQGAMPDRFQAAWLHSKHCLNKYEYYNQQTFTKVPLDDLFVQYVRNLEKYNILGHDIEMVLLDDHYDFPAWFRIVITAEPNPKIIAKWRSSARAELEKNPELEPFIVETPRIKGTLERIKNG